MKHNLQFTPDMSLDAVLRATQKWAATGDLGIPSWKKDPTKLDPTTFGTSPSMVNTGAAVKGLPGEDLGVSRAKAMSPANPVVAPFNGAVQSGAQIAKQQDAELQAHDAAVNASQQPGELSDAAQYAERRAAYIAKYSGKEPEIGAQVVGVQINRPPAFVASPNGVGTDAAKETETNFGTIPWTKDRNNPAEWNKYRDYMANTYGMDNTQIDATHNWRLGAGTANTYGDFAKGNANLAGKMFSRYQKPGEMTGNATALINRARQIFNGDPDQEMQPGNMGRVLGGGTVGVWTNNGVKGQRRAIAPYVQKDFENQQGAADALKKNSRGTINNWQEVMANRKPGYNDPKHVAAVAAADQTQRLTAGAGPAADLWKASETATGAYEKANSPAARAAAAATPEQAKAYNAQLATLQSQVEARQQAWNNHWKSQGLNGANVVWQNNGAAFKNNNDPNKVWALAGAPTPVSPVKPPTV